MGMPTLDDVIELPTRPLAWAALLTTAMVTGFAIDALLDSSSQILLGLAAWGLMVWACVGHSRADLLRTACLIVLATATEVAFSGFWGMYTYRLGNIPSYIP